MAELQLPITTPAGVVAAASEVALSPERLRALHRVTWPATFVWFGFVVAFFVAQGLLLAALQNLPPGLGRVAACAALVLVVAHLMHAHLIAFHEAAHGSLCPVRWLNDASGLFIGFAGFMSLSLYRAAHHSHHAYLATERDDELWPFVNPRSPRWFRRLAAFLELTCGLAFTPLLFLRAFLKPGSSVVNDAVRRRVWLELILGTLGWVALISAVVWFGFVTEFVVVYLLPAILSGNAQSLRKYIEHMGLTAGGALGATRSIHSPTWAGRVISFSLFHEPYHGVHHKYAKLPHGALPQLADELAPERPDDQAPYTGYRYAILAMLKTLYDPRVGPQWRPTSAAASADVGPAVAAAGDHHPAIAR